MAKTWNIAEAYAAIRENDKEGIADFGKRFPLSTVAIAKLNDDAEALVNAIPGKISLRVTEAILKDGVNESEAEDTDEEEAESEAPAKSSESPKRKRRTKAEIEAAKKAEADDSDEDEESESDYDGMTAQELFKLCKKEGITAAPKKSTKYYIDLLNAAKEEEDDDSDDWDEEPEEKPAKGKKPAKKVEEDVDEWDI